MTKTLALLAVLALVGCSADASEEQTVPTSTTDPTLGDPTKADKHEEAAAFKDALVLPSDNARSALTADHSKLTNIPNVQIKQDLVLPKPEPVESK